jgi:hypothetical protein
LRSRASISSAGPVTDACPLCQAPISALPKSILGSESVAADRYLVTARLEGNFPGGTANLKYEFAVEGDRISHLIIAPLAS